MNAPTLVLLILLLLVTASSLALLAAVVRLSLRKSSTKGTVAEAMGGAIRDAGNELVTLLAGGGEPAEVEQATARLAALLDLDPAQLRTAARARRRR